MISFKLKFGDFVVGYAIESCSVIFSLKRNKRELDSYSIDDEDLGRYYALSIMSKDTKDDFMWMKTDAFKSSLISELIHE